MTMQECLRGKITLQNEEKVLKTNFDSVTIHLAEGLTCILTLDWLHVPTPPQQTRTAVKIAMT